MPDFRFALHEFVRPTVPIEGLRRPTPGSIVRRFHADGGDEAKSELYAVSFGIVAANGSVYDSVTAHLFAEQLEPVRKGPSNA